MDEFFKLLVNVGGPAAVGIVIGLWLYVRADNRAQAAELVIREMLKQSIEANNRMANSLDDVARMIVERRQP